ncbi:MAG: hypothetical protein Q9164_003608, partial [Protoblastenia rupestris]
MPSTRASTHKKQTRLAFTPLPSSSPQRSVANIRVDESSSPAKKRRVGVNLPPSAQSSSISKSRVQAVVDSPSRKAAQLPTPAASSQVEAEREDAAEGVGLDKQNINGDKLDGSSEEDALIPQIARRRRSAAIELGNGSDTSEPVAANTRYVHDSPQATSSSKSETATRIITPPRPCSAKSFLLGGTTGTAPISRSIGRQSSTPSKAMRRRDECSTRLGLGSSDSSFSGEEATQNSPRKNLRSAAKSMRPPKEKARTKHDLDWQFSDSESDPPVSTKNGKPIPSSGTSSPKGSIVIPDTSHLSSQSENPTPVRRIRKMQQRNHAKAPLQDAEGEASDLEEEVADLQGTETRKTRTRGKPQATERSKRLHMLEELKRRRAGIVEIDENDDESEENIGEDRQEPETMDLDQYEEDFLDDEGDQIIGVDLARGGVPLRMTHYANMKPFEYFKYEIEWMIHNKLDPAFERNDEIYELAHEKLNDEVTGHAGSTFKSAVWNQDFANALTSRPEIFRIDIPRMLEHNCDACNRSGHPPKHKITLTGSKYDKNTLERISSDNSDDGDDDDDDDNTSSSDNEQNFFLGRFCCANAEMAHALYHWRYQLNQTVLQWLATEGHTTPQKVIERENWNRKKRERLANRIVDGMVEGGEMRDLYRQFKQNLDAARSAQVSPLQTNFET